MGMCLQTWPSPAIRFRVGSDSGLISRHELSALSVGVLFPIGSCSGVHCSRIQIMWEEQLVDPPIHFITSVIAL